MMNDYVEKSVLADGIPTGLRDSSGWSGAPVGQSIGAILIDSGLLSAEDAERILRLGKEEGLRFGEAAIKLGLVSEDAIRFALSRQFDYPVVIPGRSALSSDLVAAYRPHSAEVEAMRALRSQLMLRWFSGEAERRALAVVSAEGGVGRSYLAANLAIVFSQLGEHTVLVDTDMRKPKQHLLFGLENRNGLSSILSGRGNVGAIQRIDDLMDLSVLPAGSVPPNPQELLARPLYSQLMRELVEEFDIVILDTPPANEFADAHTVAVRAGAALVVARANQSRLRHVRGLIDSLTHESAHVVGTVLSEL